jgi:hypothetical protein
MGIANAEGAAIFALAPLRHADSKGSALPSRLFCEFVSLGVHYFDKKIRLGYYCPFSSSARFNELACVGSLT